MTTSSNYDNCASAIEVLTIKYPSMATSIPRNVSKDYRYSFFVKLIGGNNVNVVVQISYDGEEWFTDSATRYLNIPPELVTDRSVLTADHYACFARIAATTNTTIPGELIAVFQSQKFHGGFI
jgi:hypothetical protein